jgi:hypothetical protein
MRPHHRTLNSHQVHRSASRQAQERLALRDFKRRKSDRMRPNVFIEGSWNSDLVRANDSRWRVN